MAVSNLQANRPPPIQLNSATISFHKTSSINATITTILAGEQILINDFYSDGLLLVKSLQDYLTKKHSTNSFQHQREYRTEYRALSNLILLEIQSHKLIVKKAPQIGWLKKLYPDETKFYLSFSQIQGLNSAWQWYINGISIPGIRNKIHPYYGVYFPTRFEHIQLFDHWLKYYTGTKKFAIDIGIGCGVLSLLLIKHGFQKSFGTDINPNAIIGLAESMGDTKLSRMIDIEMGHLFCNYDKKIELIVFNPPWIPIPKGEIVENLDEAIYYHEKLFSEFFIEAESRLLPDAKIAILFSNIAQITNSTDQHPIEQELLTGGRYKLVNCFKRTVKDASEKTTRNQHWRATEEVELWILKLR